MVKLTPELVQNAYQHINPVRDRELDLRGYKIPMIENLGATLNQFDTIDFTDNDIRKLDNFPYLPRLKNVLIINNRIKRINPVLATEAIPNLESLILTNNMISELSEIDNLAGFEKLTTLSLLYNPVSTQEHYRLYVIYKLPTLKLLDFRKIKLKERNDAKELFQSKVGKKLKKNIAEAGKASMGDDDEKENAQTPKISAATDPEKVRIIQEAIARAESMEEIERLNAILQSGALPDLGRKTVDDQMEEEG